MLQYVSVLAAKEITGNDTLLLILYNFRIGEIHVRTDVHARIHVYNQLHTCTHVHTCTLMIYKLP